MRSVHPERPDCASEAFSRANWKTLLPRLIQGARRYLRVLGWAEREGQCPAVLFPPRLALRVAAVGQLDQFAKQIFAEETAQITRGGVLWVPAPELNLTEVRLDGMLRVREAAVLLDLPAPWCLAAELDGEIVFELKMQGDHCDMPAVFRAELRRQARQVARAETPKVRWIGEEPLWVTASRVPEILRKRRELTRVAPGCYRVGPSSFPFLWIAANELPLAEALIPFLVAREGRALNDFGRWVKTRRAPDWVLRMVDFLPMSTAVYDELIRFASVKTADPAIRAKQRHAAKVLLEITPEIREELVNEGRTEGRTEGRLAQERAALRRVLAHRNLALSSKADARIEACADLATLERWLDQAIDAKSAAAALR
jgi:hypothetical protein